MFLATVLIVTVATNVAIDFLAGVWKHVLQHCNHNQGEIWARQENHSPTKGAAASVREATAQTNTTAEGGIA